ncbi:hypothetical protein ABK040_016695 [Willaertia magna]
MNDLNIDQSNDEINDESVMMATNVDNSVIEEVKQQSDTFIEHNLTKSVTNTEVNVVTPISDNNKSTEPPSHIQQSPLPSVPDSYLEGLKSVFRGYRNGIMTGTKIRIPYILQSLIYAVLFRTPSEYRKVRFVIKQMFHHAMNLGSFVGMYKFICLICRKTLNIRNGIDSLIAGFIGGALCFGDSKGISGNVNNQIVLYLFARVIDGGLKALADKGFVPRIMDISTPTGFRLFAGLSLALVLYLTDYETSLKPGFMTTMDYLYKDSNSGPLRVEWNFAPIVTIITICLLIGYWFPKLRLENVLQYVDERISFDNFKKLFK